MKNRRLLSMLLMLIMMLSVIPTFATSASAASDDWTAPLSIKNNMTAAEESANYLPVSDFDESTALNHWADKGQRLEWLSDANGGYIKASGVNVNYIGFYYTPTTEIPAGTYKFTGYFRTANEGEIGCVRAHFYQYDESGTTSTKVSHARIYIENDWTYVEYYVTLTGSLSYIHINGGGYQWYVQDYCMDQFTLTAVDSIPEDAVMEFGTPNTEWEAHDSMLANSTSIKNVLTAEEKSANYLPASYFDDKTCLNYWNAKGQGFNWISDANGGYLRASRISINYTGFDYKPGTEIPAGTYKFTGYFRTANKGEIGCLRVHFYDVDGTRAGLARVYIEDEWIRVEYYVTLAAPLSYIMVNGGGYEWYIQDYCMDQFTFTAVDSIPEDAAQTFGTPNTHEEARDSMMKNWNVKPYDPVEEAKYEVKGIIINHDDSNPLATFGKYEPTVEDIANFARQYEGTHLTDYFININANCASYPSNVWTDHLDNYHKAIENGTYEQYPEGGTNRNLMYGAHYIYEVLGVDYIGIWHEEFKKIGINPWISVRMNDVHDMSSSIAGTYDDITGRSPFLSDFFWNHPEYYRIKHHEGMSYRYMDFAPDYGYEAVREHYLLLINEALDRYDTTGLELDFQRECRLFSIGGEYKGLDQLNEFMRQVDDIVAIYEEKYGHEIKIAARVPIDPVTCYDFGLDTITWISEGILDMIIPASRWDNNCSDIPVALWASIAHPHGCEVAMNIEFANFASYRGGRSGGYDIQTLVGMCSNAFSQGADKIYLFNYFASPSGDTFDTMLKDEDKVTTDEIYYGVSPGLLNAGGWNVFTSLGSPDKLLTFNRRNILTYDDTAQIWKYQHSQLPVTVSSNGSPATVHIPVGDITEDSKLFLKFSTDTDTVVDSSIVSAYPNVLVNGKECTFIKTDYCSGAFTSDTVLVYEIPIEAHMGDYMTVQISAADSRYSFKVYYAEIYVQAHD
ncbi:MAG: hypothetical protein IJY93_07135 [Clostridia bacterium]|nr:hypothetical protein [Clostridia bacterium]